MREVGACAMKVLLAGTNMAGGTPESYGYTDTNAVVARYYRASSITAVEPRRH